MPPAPPPIPDEPSGERGASGASAGTPPVPAAEGVRGGRVAGGAHGPEHLRALTAIVLDALADAAPARGGPLPAGGPEAVEQIGRAHV